MEAWGGGRIERDEVMAAAGSDRDAGDVDADAGPEDRCSSGRYIVDADAAKSGGGVCGIRVVLSIEDQPPVRNAGAG